VPRDLFVALLCLPFLVQGGALPAAADDDLAAQVRRIVEDERERWHTPGMSVAVVRDGQVVVQLASGLADREAAKPMLPETQVPAASISKLFTAVLVMRQVERGRLALDVPVREYLEERYWIRDARGAPVDVTLRQLLSHHAGLPVSWSGIVRGDDPVPSLEEHLARGQVTIHRPGEHVVYANDGFSLAGFLAAQADGRGFAEHARLELLDPLGMRDSTFASPRTLSGGRLAAAYGGLLGGTDRSVHDDPTPNAPAGALVTTAPDLARFALMLLGGGTLDGVAFLRPESIEEMWRLQAREAPTQDEGFGLGFGVRERPGRKLVWWDGSLSGAANRFALLPEHGVGVVVLGNLSENAASSETADRVLEILVPSAPLPRYEPSALELAHRAGSYRFVDMVPPNLWFLSLALVLELSPRDGTLWQESWLTKASALVPLGPDRFRVQGSMLDGADLVFDGEDVLVGFMRARRIGFWETPAALGAYAGMVGLALLVAIGLAARRIARGAGGKRRSQEQPSRGRGGS